MQVGTSCKGALYIVFFFFNLFIYPWLRWVFAAARGLSLVVASGGHSSLRCAGFSLQWPLPLGSTGSRCVGFSSCGSQAPELWRRGSVALRHVGSSWTRPRTRVPCTGRWTPNHCATWEAPIYCLSNPCGSCFSFLRKT